MKKLDLKKLYRYEDSDKKFHIDIQIDFYRDVYNEWDFSPFHNRDLNKDLLEYLLECCYEIPVKHQIAIDFFLPDKIESESREAKNMKGIKNYFKYIIRKQRIAIRALLKNTLLYFLAGLLLLFFAYFTSDFVTNEFIFKIAQEGLLIGAWVLIWEIFSIIFFKLTFHLKELKHYKRLYNAEINYHYR